jgi:dihydroorotate dehydrogenase
MTSDSRSPALYGALFRAFFTGMDPERAHQRVVGGLKWAHRVGAGRALLRLTKPDPALEVEVLGRRWPSPFGLAAGFDKGATAVLPLADLGFGHIEIGTVTAQPQPGNPAPRLFRLVEDRALINRMGFNNDGAVQVRRRLDALRAELTDLARRGRYAPVLGVNIGKTKATPLEDAVEDYLSSARELAPVADYLVVNVSSPNTPGLRQLQEIQSLEPLLRRVKEVSRGAAGRHVPLLVKIAPDMSDDDTDAVADLVEEVGLDGVVATNTTISRTGLQAAPDDVEALGAGGLSGPVLAQRSLELLGRLRRRLPQSTAIISVGGVTSAEDVIERLNAGADLVQGYTAFVYQGPLWVQRINRGLRQAVRSGELRLRKETGRA